MALQSARHVLLLLLVLSVNARKTMVGAYDAAAALTTKRKPFVFILLTTFGFLITPLNHVVLTMSFSCVSVCIIATSKPKIEIRVQDFSFSGESAD